MNESSPTAVRDVAKQRPLLQAFGLDKRFGGPGAPWLFRIEALSFEPGARYALTGRNGAGKSTLLRILAGLEGAQAGQVAWNGERVDAARLPRAYPQAWRRHVVYVHQHPYVFDATVWDNAAYPLRAHGLWDDKAPARVADLLAWGGLAPLRDARAHKLSGGEKQRLALVRALSVAPEVLLLDEPTSNLDGQARERMLQLVDDLGTQGRTLVVVTHDRDLLGSRTFERLKLADGHLQARVTG